MQSRKNVCQSCEQENLSLSFVTYCRSAVLNLGESLTICSFCNDRFKDSVLNSPSDFTVNSNKPQFNYWHQYVYRYLLDIEWKVSIPYTHYLYRCNTVCKNSIKHWQTNWNNVHSVMGIKLTVCIECSLYMYPSLPSSCGIVSKVSLVLLGTVWKVSMPKLLSIEQKVSIHPNIL